MIGYLQVPKIETKPGPLSSPPVTVWRVLDLLSGKNPYLALVARFQAGPVSPVDLELSMPGLNRTSVARVMELLCGASMLVRIDHETAWERSRHALTPIGLSLISGLGRLRSVENHDRTSLLSTDTAPGERRRGHQSSFELVRKLVRRRGAAVLLMHVPPAVFTSDALPWMPEMRDGEVKRGLVMLCQCAVLTRSRFRSGRPREYQLSEMGRELQTFLLEIEGLTRPPERVPSLSSIMENAG